MKRSQLEAIIREALSEVLNEQDSPKTLKLKQDLLASQEQDIKTQRNNLNKTTTGKIGEGELDEFANQPGRYELSPEANAADFTRKKAQIITAMQDNGGSMTQLDVALALGYNTQNPVNSDFRDLLSRGIIVPSGTQTARRPIVAPVRGGDNDDEENEGPDELPSGYEDPEGGVAGNMSDEEVDAGFPRPIRLGGGEEEPEAGEIETGGVNGASMSDDEFQAWMTYQDLERRLANVKSNILKARKSRPTPGDIADRPSNEVENLRDLKKKLEDKMMAIVSQFPTVAKDYKAPEIEIPDEEPLDEWTINKMKFYAGIIK
jgi:hypothetical protein